MLCKSVLCPKHNIVTLQQQLAQPVIEDLWVCSWFVTVVMIDIVCLPTKQSFFDSCPRCLTCMLILLVMTLSPCVAFVAILQLNAATALVLTPYEHVLSSMGVLRLLSSLDAC